MGQIKRHGNPRHPIRRKPFVGQPHVGTEEELAGGKFGVELLNLGGQEGPLEGDAELAHGEGQQLLVGPRDPFRLGSLAVRRGHFLFRDRCIDALFHAVNLQEVL